MTQQHPLLHLPWARGPVGRPTLIIASVFSLAMGGCHDGRSGAVGGRNRTELTPQVALPTPPRPLPNDVAALDPASARKANAALPFANQKIEIASPVVYTSFNQQTAAGDPSLQCLTAAVYYEAGSESLQGQRAVAQVVLNRVRHPSFPNSVCGVVYQGSERSTGCQFTFTCDGSLRRTPSPRLWARAQQVAERALEGWVEPSVGMATHYHTDWVFPYWAPSLKKIAQVGAHIFYTWPGGWGRRSAFKQQPVWQVSAGKLAQPEVGDEVLPSLTSVEHGPLPPALAADEPASGLKPSPQMERKSGPTLRADEQRGTLIPPVSRPAGQP